MEYRVEDHSLLLPTYRRWLLDPLVALIPASLSPNVITHLAHLANLSAIALPAAMGPPARGWPYFVAAGLHQLYIWLDNADGAHARRTGQSSPGGELLDHGLDIPNVAYMACLTALAMGAPAPGWLLLVMALMGSQAALYWEQAETGLLRLGRINQLEYGLVLSSLLVLAGAIGTSWWETPLLSSVTLRTAILGGMAAGSLVGVVAVALRVARAKGAATLWLAGILLAFTVATVAAAALGAVPVLPAVALAALGYGVFSLSMLLRRRLGRAGSP